MMISSETYLSRLGKSSLEYIGESVLVQSFFVIIDDVINWTRYQFQYNAYLAALLATELTQVVSTSF